MWAGEFATRVSLWELLVLLFLSFYLLCKKLKNLWHALENDYEEFFECFAALSLADQDTDDFGDDSSAPPESCETDVASSFKFGFSIPIPQPEKNSLIEGLSDAIVREHIWTKLKLPPSISLIYRLRRVSKSWRELINSNIEWVALEFIRRDASGYHVCSARHYCRILSRYERLLAEI